MREIPWAQTRATNWLNWGSVCAGASGLPAQFNPFSPACASLRWRKEVGLGAFLECSRKHCVISGRRMGQRPDPAKLWVKEAVGSPAVPFHPLLWEFLGFLYSIVSVFACFIIFGWWLNYSFFLCGLDFSNKRIILALAFSPDLQRHPIHLAKTEAVYQFIANALSLASFWSIKCP